MSPDSTFFPAILAAQGDMYAELGDADAARRAFERLAQLESTDQAVAYGLVKLAEASENTEAARLYRKAWTNFPRAEVSALVNERLGTLSAAAPTWQERSIRSEKLMWRGEYKSAIAESERALKGVGETKTTDACRVIYVRGRSYYKTNQLSSAIGAFNEVEKRCAGVSDQYGASSLYLKGQAQFRTRRYSDAVKTFQLIPEHFPKHSMAEDGLLHAGIAAIEAEETATAQSVWTRAIASYPDGDMTPEAAWRLAWSYYSSGKTSEALKVVDSLAEKPVTSDWEHIVGAMYWAARWRAYPAKSDPTKLNEDAAAVKEAVSRWHKLCETHPDPSTRS